MTLTFAPWAAATNCTDGPQPGARALLAWLQETSDTGRSLGIYNCRTVRGASTTSTHGEGRAVDWGMPLGGSGRGTTAGHRLVRRLGEHGRRLGIQCIIYDRLIWSDSSPEGRRYYGVAPHFDHLHIELTRTAAAVLNLATLRAVLDGAAPPRPATPEPVVTDQDIGDFMATLSKREQAAAKAFFQSLVNDQGFDPDDKAPAKAVGDLARTVAAANSSVQGVVIGSLSAIDTLRADGKTIDTTQRRAG